MAPQYREHHRSDSTGFDGRIVYTSLWDGLSEGVAEQFVPVRRGRRQRRYLHDQAVNRARLIVNVGLALGGLRRFRHRQSGVAQLDTLYTYEHSGQDNALFMNSNNASNGTLLADPAVSYDGVQHLRSIPGQFRCHLGPVSGRQLRQVLSGPRRRGYGIGHFRVSAAGGHS